MDNYLIKNEVLRLSTPLLADACVRNNIKLRVLPKGIAPLKEDWKIAERVMPVLHQGSVDVFMEAIELAFPGDILVIDNQLRDDEGCVGDLTALEAKEAGLGGIVVYGCHRDTAELMKIDLPLFSYGAYPAGPLRSDEGKILTFEMIQLDLFQVNREDFVFADSDGALFVSIENASSVFETAKAIGETELEQANQVKAGVSLREQFNFTKYLENRENDSSYTFRKHLKIIGGAIEE